MNQDFLKTGLTSETVSQLTLRHGPNNIERKKEIPALRILLNQFKSPLIYILFFAGLTTSFLGKTTDSIVIFLTVFVNTVLGYFQEAKAEKSLIALRKLIIPTTHVIRDSQQIMVETSQIVPGDLIVLKTGESIPADGVIVQDFGLHINEAILTGESASIHKSKIRNLDFKLSDVQDHSQAYMGTVIVSGRGTMIAQHIGMDTKIGKIAGNLAETIDEETPLKKKIHTISKKLTLIFSLISIIIFVEGYLHNREMLEMFELVVATAVAAIPEGLVISLTVILSLGMQRLLKHKALVRKLLAAETLGGVSVICTDKTGTLTEGVMKVVKSDFTNPTLGLRAAVLCNNLINPTEIAIWDWAKTQLQEGEISSLTDGTTRLDEIPFSSQNKYFATLYQNELFVLGAPEKILAISNLTNKEKKKWLKKINSYATDGLRVISFAYKKDKDHSKLKNLLNSFRKSDSISSHSLNSKLEWLGLVAFEDPVRMSVKQSLTACQKAGIDIKVITGDYKETALAVLKKLDLVGKNKPIKILEGYELEKITDQELARQVKEVTLFARINPADKTRIVEALQSNGEVVAMTGDGVNDAPALKKADIGIVVGDATEIAKETADMVLLDSNFQTIVTAVEQGRAMFENIRKVVLYLLSDSLTEVVLISAALFLGTPLPILATQILWINLIEDGLPGLALAFEPTEKGLMNDPPRSREEPIINREVLVLIFAIGLLTDLILLGIFLFLLGKEVDLATIRTVIFAGLAIDSLFYVYSCKSLRKNLWNINIFSNNFLNISVLLGFLMLFLGIYLPLLNTLLGTTPLSLNYWAIIIGFGVIDIIAIETVKWFFITKPNFSSR